MTGEQITLRNARHERFAQYVAAGKSLTEALKLTGYRSDGRYSTRLTSRDEIRRRIATLQMRNVEKADESSTTARADLEAMLRNAYALAVEVKRPADAVSAVVALAKLNGHWVERSERTAFKGDLEKLTDAELAQIMRDGENKPSN